MNETKELVDVQLRSDERGVAIDNVGICDLVYPIRVYERDGGKQHVTARISASVHLPHYSRGTHMSRFLEVLAGYEEITMGTMPSILDGLKRKLDAASAKIEVEFGYFVMREAPVSKLRAPMDYQCAFIGESNGEEERFVLRVCVPVATLCPCSKAISDYGAHNQRGYVTIAVRTVGFVWIEELISVAENLGSASVYPLLKRRDERHVTMKAYDNPCFVEDVVRTLSGQLRGDARIRWFSVKCVNQESIHNHSAFAELSQEKVLS